MKSINLMFFLAILPFAEAYTQQNLEQALNKGGWTGGLAGWIGWEDFNAAENLGDSSSQANVDGFNFIFNSRNGSIVETNGVFGFDFQWREKSRTTKPEPNPFNESEHIEDKVWFLGLWARYYIPWGGNFAMFLEGSGGYAVYSQKIENISTLEYVKPNPESFANGFAYNLGIGFAHFISPNAAFEITGRWEGGSLNGEKKESGSTKELNVKLGNIFLLFGFQVYLR